MSSQHADPARVSTPPLDEKSLVQSDHASTDDGYKSSNDQTPKLSTAGDSHGSTCFDAVVPKRDSMPSLGTCGSDSCVVHYHHNGVPLRHDGTQPVPIMATCRVPGAQVCIIAPKDTSDTRSTPVMTPFGAEVSSSSSIGGHHLSVTVGDIFMKQSCSGREECFYKTLQPYQEALVEDAVRHAPHTIAVWSGECVDEDAQTTREDAADSEAAQARRLAVYKMLQAVERAEDTTLTVSGAVSALPEAAPPEVVAASASEKEQVRLAASLWWTGKWTRPLPLWPCLQPTCCTDLPLDEAAATLSSRASAVTEAFSVNSEDKLPPHSHEEKEVALTLLAPFVPLFHGLRRLTLPQIAHLTSPFSRVDHSALPLVIPHDADGEDDDTEEMQMVALEDTCNNFSRPCVLDVKMGARQYGLHPSDRKRKKKEWKSRNSTSGEYGMRLAGLRRWDDATQNYVSKTKLQCRHFTLTEVKEEIRDFCRDSKGLELVFLRQLKRLREAFQKQTVYRFYTSSLLFVYDASQPLQTARIVMVDFAFAYERRELLQGKDPDGEFDYDINYIKAIDTLVSLLS